MSMYYKGKRTRNLYKPGDEKPFRLSRSKLELFMNCPRCFYLDRRLGVGQLMNGCLEGRGHRQRHFPF